MRQAVLALLLLSTAPIAAAAAAQSGQPAASVPANFTRAEPLAKVDTIPAARDVAFPGTIRLHVDVTDLDRRIIRVKETIPVAEAGHMVLLYPKWLPGAHSPSGAINKVAGLTIHAGGKRLDWVRDTLDVYAFHVDVPAGATSLDVEFQFVSPTAEGQGRTVITPDMASIQWIATSLYPAGYYVRNIPVEATLTMPQGWTAATSLRPATGSAPNGSPTGGDRRSLTRPCPTTSWSIRRRLPAAISANGS
ncbi:hypothetical protein [Sphingosinicella sp. BN140058]|uniref:M61 family metallopeptidase n=1 Tax=Sphingosinicella sp. BN140058 TaxID=1892855 RepID=UPI0026A9DA86